MALHIKDIDENLATDRERTDIEQSTCLNCDQPLKGESGIIFTRVGPKQKILWWHVDHCNADHYK